MKIRVLTRNESKIAMQQWIEFSKLESLEPDYNKLREDLNYLYGKVINNFKKDYDIDLYFGMEIYTYFNSQKYFNITVATDDGFWRYLSIKVIPDIVEKRWGKTNEDHYWKRSTRIWLKSLWWYIYLSWQGSKEKTLNILKNNTTDEIMNLVERAGKKGYYVNVYRNIMYFYNEARNNYKDKYISRNLFRKIMVLHIARSNVIEPSLCCEGEKGYVKSLFRDSGIEL